MLSAFKSLGAISASPQRLTHMLCVGSASPGQPSGLGKLESTRIPQKVRQRVEDAVESLGGRVTIGDVSSRAGLTLAETERALNALAADSEGTLQVGS